MAIIIDSKKCNGCAECEPACPMAAMIVKEKAQIIEEWCNECGICIEICSENAIHLTRESHQEEKIACNS